MARRRLASSLALLGLRIAGLALVAAPSPAAAALATICVNPAGGSPAGEFCHTTIQAAVDAARPGALIRVMPAVYHERVVVAARQDGIQIVGDDRATTILDVPPAGEAAITVRSNDVQIRSLTIQHFGIAVSLQARRGIVQELTVLNGSASPGIAATGPDSAGHQVLSNDVQGGIALFGADTVARGNHVTAGNLLVNGARGQVIENLVERGGISVFNFELEPEVVRGNQVRGADTGIQAFLRNPVVENNEVRSAQTGLSISCLIRAADDLDACRSGSISGNTVAFTVQHGIAISAPAPGLPVRGNRVMRTGRGLSVSGVGALVEDNRVSESGFGFQGRGYEALGPSHALRRNVASRCTAGFFVNGSAVQLEQNRVLGSFGNGIMVEGSDGAIADVVLDGNSSLGNNAVGIAILHGARDTTVTGNTATSNGLLDFCDDGVGTILSSNVFGTVGSCGGLR
jgi:hypothetical protein